LMPVFLETLGLLTSAVTVRRPVLCRKVRAKNAIDADGVFFSIPAMYIRPATKADLAGILEIYNEAVLNTTASYDYEPRSLEHRIAWFEEHQRQKYPVFVATTEQGNIVGWSSLSRFHDRMGYRFTAENSIYVAAEQRGRGIG